jgi:mono/diheme cytochrome c family protein
VGVAVGPDGSLYISDSVKGRVWRIFYAGEDKRAASAERTAAVSVSPEQAARGAELYGQACAPCHMTDGQGIPGVQPALAASALVTGDPETLIALTLRGPDAVLPARRASYPNKMPGFAFWNDDDVAAVLTHTRRSFGNEAAPVTPDDVAAVRALP